LTERLLAFARRKPLEPKLLNANVLVSRMSDLLQRTLGENIDVSTRLADNLWTIEVDPMELETAIVNLAVNARDAMPRGGKVVIETKNIEIDRERVDDELKPGGYVLISVADTGCGMEPDVLRQVFEPFFTTKSAGRGTGLGLSQVYGFVKQSGGHVEIESEPERGTTANIYLPKAATEKLTHDDVGPQVENYHPAGQRSESVLVVEDDHDVRSYTVNSLSDLGYTVLEAADAASALELIQRESGLALLFTDLGLPGGMDGKALAQRAREVRPNLKVLITTAYAGDALVHEGRLDQGVDLLMKPFTFANLATRVRNAIDSGETPGSKPWRILVVEDEPLIRILVAEALSDIGCIVTEAASGKEALALARSHNADLDGAIIDLGLPDLSGEEVLSKIRATRPEVPIVLATGFVSDELRRRLAHDRYTTLIQKPFEPDTLVRALRGLQSAGATTS
jgi:CheY-like chemotaxis protein